MDACSGGDKIKALLGYRGPLELLANHRSSQRYCYQAHGRHEAGHGRRPVGDDVLGDDPTVAALERRVADILGMEAAVYMPSGTMTNQVAIRARTEPGDEIVAEAQSHVYYYEGGGRPPCRA